MANVRANGTSQTSFDERAGEAATSFALRSIGFANREASAFQVPNDPWFDNRGRRIDDTANHARCVNVFTNHAAGIDTFQSHAFPFAAVGIEVPPRKTILGSED